MQLALVSDLCPEQTPAFPRVPSCPTFITAPSPGKKPGRRLGAHSTVSSRQRGWLNRRETLAKTQGEEWVLEVKPKVTSQSSVSGVPGEWSLRTRA